MSVGIQAETDLQVCTAYKFAIAEKWFSELRWMDAAFNLVQYSGKKTCSALT